MLAKIIDLYVELDDVQAERFADELKKEGNEEIQDMVITWEETIAASEARGNLTATRKSILRILKRRLKSVPAFVRQKLDTIGSIERLEEILDQALTVNSVDELIFEGPAG